MADGGKKSRYVERDGWVYREFLDYRGRTRRVKVRPIAQATGTPPADAGNEGAAPAPAAEPAPPAEPQDSAGRGPAPAEASTAGEPAASAWPWVLAGGAVLALGAAAAWVLWPSSTSGSTRPELEPGTTGVAGGDVLPFVRRFA